LARGLLPYLPKEREDHTTADPATVRRTRAEGVVADRLRWREGPAQLLRAWAAAAGKDRTADPCREAIDGEGP